MSDTLTVSGATSVVIDELLAHAARLGAVADRAESWSGQLNALSLDYTSEWVSDPASTAQLREAEKQARLLAEEGERLQTALIMAAEGYGLAERTVTSFMSFGAQVSAWSAGVALPFLAAFGVPMLAGGALVAARLGASLGLSPKQAGSIVGQWLRSQPSLVNSPAFVRFVRGLASSADEFAMGVARVPLPVAVGLGSQLKAEQSAAVITTLGTIAGVASGSRLLRESAQHVSMVGREKAVTPPRGLADLADRVPSPAAGGPQLRVERYGTEDDSKWVVYVTGTMEFSPIAASETLDFTSNMHAVAGNVSATEQAVRDALLAAGAQNNDELLLVGHSQGGLIAARLAESSDLNVVAFVNMGGPIGAVSTADVPGLSIEHHDDVVPAVTGAGERQPGLTTVGRTVLDGTATAGEASGGESRIPFAAHALTHYRDTAALVEASDDPRLQQLNELLRDFPGDDDGVRTAWRSDRVHPAVG